MSRTTLLKKCFGGLILATLTSSCCHGQSIFSVLHRNEQRDYRGAKPQKIMQESIFYSPSGKQTEKSVKVFDPSGMLLSEERFDKSGVRTFRMTHKNDTTRLLLLESTIENWMKIGYMKSGTRYTYDSLGHLIRITNTDAGGQVSHVAELVNDERGNPLMLALYDGKGKPVGNETAEYLYEENKVVTKVIGNDGLILSSDTITINFARAHEYPAPGNTYNEHGDLVTWNRKNWNGSYTLFEHEYRYDEQGNCVEDKRYEVSVKGGGKRKRTLSSHFKRTFVY